MIRILLWHGRVEVGYDEPEERRTAESIASSWIVYGAIHVTNHNGLSVLDPKRIIYNTEANTDGEPLEPHAT